jgi:hypothetical protein
MIAAYSSFDLLEMIMKVFDNIAINKFIKIIKLVKLNNMIKMEPISSLELKLSNLIAP